MIFRSNNQEVDFVVHEHSVGGTIDYQLSIQDGDELRFLSFLRTGEMATISDVPNITRLFGRESEDTRALTWLTYQGMTKNSEGGDDDPHTPGVYKILDSGKAIVGHQTEEYSEVFLSGESLSDRWIIRKLPNLFPSVFKGSDDIYLLWKPPVQKKYEKALNSEEPYNNINCACPVNNASSKFAELTKEEGVAMGSTITTDMLFNPEAKTFEGVGAAEGTWIDMFGNKYTYTPEFIVHNYEEQRSRLAAGEIIQVNTHHETEHEFEGRITEVQLFQQPIKHIVVKGTYNGPVDLDDRQFGLSYEYRLRSVWNEEFQSWVPFEATTDKISVVERPACKVCWINKVK